MPYESLFREWRAATARLSVVDQTPGASAGQVRSAEQGYLAATWACERACAEIDRAFAMIDIALVRARALESISETARTCADMPALIPDLVDQIANNAVSETNLIFEAWVPGPGEMVN